MVTNKVITRIHIIHRLEILWAHETQDYEDSKGTANHLNATGSMGAQTADRGSNTLGQRPHFLVWDRARVCLL